MQYVLFLKVYLSVDGLMANNNMMYMHIHIHSFTFTYTRVYQTRIYDIL